MSLTKVSQAIALAVCSACLAAPAFAEEVNEAEAMTINQPTVPQAFEAATGFDKYWAEYGLLGDAKWLFGVEYDEARISRRSRAAETVYLDMMRQYDQDTPTFRMQDLPTPYDSTVDEL